MSLGGFIAIIFQFFACIRMRGFGGKIEESGDKAMLIEVKTKLTKERINKHIKRLGKMRKYADIYGDKRAFLGAVAGFAITEEVREIAFDHDRETVITFTPDDDLIWINAGFADNKIDVGGIPLMLQEQNTFKISGTININIDGTFPAGGIKLEAVYEIDQTPTSRALRY